jgi:hypothetical protein
MATRRTANKVSVGYFGSELHTVVVEKDATVEDAFEAAGITIGSDEKIVSLSGSKVSKDAVAKNDETYYLSKKLKNQKLGSI